MNGLAILNNERFLEKCEPRRPGAAGGGALSSPPPNSTAHCLPAPPADGWGFSQLGNNPMGPSPNALKYQIIGTLHAAAYMRGGPPALLLWCGLRLPPPLPPLPPLLPPLPPLLPLLLLYPPQTIPFPPSASILLLHPASPFCSAPGGPQLTGGCGEARVWVASRSAGVFPSLAG